jgi:hypothetical protein
MPYRTPTYAFQKPRTALGYAGFVLIVLALLSWERAAIEKTTNREFDIFFGSKHVGFLKLSETRSPEETFIQVHSEIETRLIFRYTVEGTETYQYRNDTLVASRLYRKINDKVRLDHRIIKNGAGYRMLGPDLDRKLETGSVQMNLTRLFFEEPKGQYRVFSDRFGQWVPVEKMGVHQYKIPFPNGSSSTFSYENGKCISVVNSGSFYTVHLLPRPEAASAGRSE